MTSTRREAIFPEDLFVIHQKVVVVIDRPWPEITAEQRNLLQKILVAVRLSLDGVTLLQPYQLNSTQLRGQQIISFGWNPDEQTKYEPMQWGTCSIVVSDSLDQLILSDESKKKLWQGLKKLFPN